MSLHYRLIHALLERTEGVCVVVVVVVVGGAGGGGGGGGEGRGGDLELE